MKEWYLERVNDLEKQVAFAKVGYKQTIKTLGEKLVNSESDEEIDKIIEELNASNKAMKALKSSYDSALESYRKEGGAE